MAKVKFGKAQLQNPTPSGLAFWVNIMTVIFGCLIAWIGSANFIPANTSSVLQSILGLLLAISNSLKPFFGVETSQKTVPIDQVTQMDTKPED